MTALDVRGAATGFLRRAATWHRPLMLMTAFMAVMAGLTLSLIFLDHRMLYGERVWQKPFNFAMSIGTFTLTWAWMLSLLPRGRRFAGWVGMLLVLLLGIEWIGLVVQATRGVRSHFNKTTPFDTDLGTIMGLSAALILLSTLALAVVFFVARIADRAGVWAIRLGALLSVAGMSFGPMMGNETEAQKAAQAAGAWDGISGGHSVGVPDGGPGMLITGWSTTGGDLRVPHLVGIHGLQVLPLFAILLSLLAVRYSRLRRNEVRARLVWVAAIGYAGLLVTVAWQAFRAQSLIHPDGRTGLAFGAVALFVGIGFALVIGLARTVPEKRQEPVLEI